jgi:hypothetical protein
MSGMFTESKFPSGVTADAYYQKRGGVADLVKMVETLPLPRNEHRDTPEPKWIQRNGYDAKGEEFVTIACPECFRTFPQAINGTASLILDTNCAFCGGWILWAIVEPRSLEFPQPFRLVPRFADHGIHQMIALGQGAFRTKPSELSGAEVRGLLAGEYLAPHLTPHPKQHAR